MKGAQVFVGRRRRRASPHMTADHERHDQTETRHHCDQVRIELADVVEHGVDDNSVEQGDDKTGRDPDNSGERDDLLRA